MRAVGHREEVKSTVKRKDEGSGAQRRGKEYSKEEGRG
jgi:hypothetical protein